VAVGAERRWMLPSPASRAGCCRRRRAPL